MFRIRFASGEEASFRTVQHLAEGIRSGVVPATAEIFHAKSQQWLPIAVHPVYEQAAKRVAGASPANAESQGVPAESINGNGFQIYQMVSQSAIELAQRRRPQWLGQAASVACGLAVVAGLT